jgi:hypothetical protein
MKIYKVGKGIFPLWGSKNCAIPVIMRYGKERTFEDEWILGRQYKG